MIAGLGFIGFRGYRVYGAKGLGIPVVRGLERKTLDICCNVSGLALINESDT